MPSPRPHVVSHVSGWTSVALGDGVDANMSSGQIQDAYMGLHVLGKITPDFAVFTYYDLRVSVVTAYFSPTAASLGQTFGALPCDPPTDKEGFSLLVGDARSRSLLFRE